MQNLDSIIKKALRETLNDANKTPNFVDSLDNEVYLKLYVDYLSTHSSYGFNPLSLTEGLIQSYPIDKTIEHVKKFFNLDSKQIRKIDCGNNIQQILVDIPVINANEELVINAFNKCGYHLGYKNIFLDRFGNQWLSLQFEPKFQKDETLTIRQEEQTLYHLTPSYNKGKILNIGFSPRCKNEMFHYPNRTYFLRGSTDKNEILNLGQQLFYTNSSLGNNGDYILFQIDLSLVPDDVRFFIDSNHPYGIFTSDNIKPNAIIHQEPIHFYC